MFGKLIKEAIKYKKEWRDQTNNKGIYRQRNEPEGRSKVGGRWWGGKYACSRGSESSTSGGTNTITFSLH